MARCYYDRECHRCTNKLRRSKDGIIFGLCEGFANWTGLPVGLVRIATIIAFLLTGFWPVGVLYILISLLTPAC